MTLLYALCAEDAIGINTGDDSDIATRPINAKTRTN